MLLVLASSQDCHILLSNTYQLGRRLDLVLTGRDQARQEPECYGVLEVEDCRMKAWFETDLMVAARLSNSGDQWI